MRSARPHWTSSSRRGASNIPNIGFTRLAVGDSFGGAGDSQTEFNKNWDPEALDTAIRFWMEHGYMQGGLIDADHLVEVVYSVLHCGKSSFIPYLTMARPASPTRSRNSDSGKGHQRVTHESRMLIDGKLVESETGRQFDNINPATRKCSAAPPTAPARTWNAPSPRPATRSTHRLVPQR